MAAVAPPEEKNRTSDLNIGRNLGNHEQEASTDPANLWTQVIEECATGEVLRTCIARETLADFRFGLFRNGATDHIVTMSPNPAQVLRL